MNYIRITFFLVTFLWCKNIVSAQGDVNCNEIINFCNKKLPKTESAKDSLFYMKNLALAYFDCSNFEEAFFWYQKSYLIDTGDLNIKFDMALSASKSGKYSTAITIYRDLQNSEIDDCSLAIGLGNTFYKAGMFEESIEVYNDYYARCSFDLVFLNNLGVALIETNDFKESEVILKQASELDKSSVQTIRNMAYLYLMNGNYMKAKNLIDIVFEDNPKDKFVNYYLGLYYENTNEHNLACKYYKEASELGHPESTSKFKLKCKNK